LTAYSSAVSLRTAREQYFREAGLPPEGNYSTKWEKIPVGPLWFPLPNPRMRSRVLPLHDLHHVATGYDTSWRGEAEIAAWELAAGCGTYVVPWVLNLAVFGVGLFIAPRRLWRAFSLGRRCNTLYTDRNPPDLDSTVGELRHRLRLDA
jgi:hypothetical protein